MNGLHVLRSGEGQRRNGRHASSDESTWCRTAGVQVPGLRGASEECPAPLLSKLLSIALPSLRPFPSPSRQLGKMTATTHPEFNEDTEGLEVAKAFGDQVKGKTILITGVNPKGIGFTTAEGFVRASPSSPDPLSDTDLPPCRLPKGPLASSSLVGRNRSFKRASTH